MILSPISARLVLQCFFKRLRKFIFIIIRAEIGGKELLMERAGRSLQTMVTMVDS